MFDYERLRYLFGYKEVTRAVPIGERWETDPEHTVGLLFLADYFLPQIDQALDRLRVYEILLYHDLVELEAGDVDFLADERDTKQAKEATALEVICAKMPANMVERFRALHREYEEAVTLEAKFCKALDKLEPAVQLIGNKEEFHERKFTEEIMIRKKRGYQEPFPVLVEFFDGLMTYFRENGYFADRAESHSP